MLFPTDETRQIDLSENQYISYDCDIEAVDDAIQRLKSQVISVSHLRFLPSALHLRFSFLMLSSRYIWERNDMEKTV